ncbi:MAG: ubiquinone biosynthesis protein [Flavobacteriales bacterium]|nr:AarF/ABC1/UbiB kinase family protein [Bacteroidales bacterium AH-315-I05]PCJ86356.1 MAG: ubiquinone biosynthesis protein [Flavobacteriales bacterium]
MPIGQTLRNLNRTREIIQVLVKYGFEDIVANSTLRNFVPEKKRLTWLRKDKPVLQYTRWERIRMAAEELGPTFIKLAQVLSIRPDIIPEPLIKEFEKLQDKVTPFEYEKVREIIRSETKQEIEELFDEFNEKPLASASIGQVHRAKLKTGEEVVVKIQRPGVADVVERDLAILKEAVSRAERYLKKQGMLNPKDVVRAFDRSITKELDYKNEGRNIEKFRNFYKNYRNFYIPKAYRDISTQKVLVIEFADGCKINDTTQLRAWGLDPRKIAENGMGIYLTQIFEYGYFHADPHPGNVFVRKDAVICLIDFGMTGRLMQKDKYAFANIFIAMSQQDPKRMANAMKKLSISDEIEDMRAFQYDLNELIEDFVDLDVSEASIADMTLSLQKIMYDYRIIVPPSIFLIFRAFAILEGIGKQVHPHFNTYDFIKPYGRKILEDQFSPKNIWNELSYRAEQFNDFAVAFPRDLKEIISKGKKGKLHFTINHQGYGYLLKKLDSLTNRFALAMIISSLIIAAAITTLREYPPEQMTSLGISNISAWALLLAGGFFLVLCYAIIRRRKYK